MMEILFPARWIYQGATGFRNWLYDRAWLRIGKVDAKVIVIGNLTVGGTGKTPVALAVIDLLKKKNISCALISRGYKRQIKGVHEVDTSPAAAFIFGDEPALIKATHPDVPVVVGEKRVLAAEAALSLKAVDAIVCDDAFQHRSLHRDLNILLFDATEHLSNYRVLPVGLARESLLPALKRADIVVLTKTNLVSPDELKDRLFWLKSKCEKPIVEAEYSFEGVRNIKGERRQELKDACFLVTGVAKPKTVENTLKDRFKIVKHKTFDDHHRYTQLEIETMLDEASHLGARWILTPGKDAVKLGAFNSLRERLWIIELGVQFKGEVQALYEAVDRLARPGN